MIDITKIKEGTVIMTADLRKREVSRVDGKYVYFKDGTQYRFTHPDLVEIVDVEEEPKPKKSSRKKKTEETEGE